MIVKIKGRLVEKCGHALIIDVKGLYYEVLVPLSVLNRIDESVGKDGEVNLITYHYFQIDPARGIPILIGFLNDLEKDFFLRFITVSGIGPRAAIKALNKPISEITRAIDSGDLKFLTTLPGIGTQRAKEIVAKLQGKVGRFGLLEDKESMSRPANGVPDWQQEALAVLEQLQYKRQEALGMIEKALQRSQGVNSAEELLNEIYKQKVRK